MDLFFWIALLLVALIFVSILKHFFNAKTFVIFAMVRSERLAKLLDRFKNKTFWNFVAKTGIFMGFGFIGVWYWFRKDRLRWTRIFISQLFVFAISIFFFLQMLPNLGLTKTIIGAVFFNLFGFAGLAIFFLAAFALKIVLNFFAGKPSCPGVAPVIPGVKIPGLPYIPLKAWVAILIILVLHEFAHGILARLVKVPVKSFGLLFVGFLPIGAFTEPDEEKLEKAKEKDQLKVYAAGPSINFYLAVFVLLISLVFGLILNPYLTKVHNELVDGVYIVKVTEYTGYCQDGIKSKNFGVLDENVKVLKIGNYEIRDLVSFLKAKKALLNENVRETTIVYEMDGKIIEKPLVFNDDNEWGIQVLEKMKDVKKPFWYVFWVFIFDLLHWLWLLSLMVAIFNFLPSEPFDGGKMIKIIGSVFLPKNMPREKKYKIIGVVSLVIVGILFLINLLPLFF